MSSTSSPVVEVCETPDELAERAAAEAAAGLRARPRRLPASWLYDERGSALFSRITTLPEYYPTRAERAILAAAAPEVAARSEASALVELGSGTSDKTRLLLDAMEDRGALRRFVGLDVAEPTLRAALGELGGAYPRAECSGVVGDFERHLHRLPGGPGRLLVFLGGTIGNLEPARRRAFLAAAADALAPGEHFLVGADLVKDPARLEAAYDDGAGVTAAFERNVLRVVNERLGAEFDPADFDYVATWEPGPSWVRMALRARRRLRVPVRGLGAVLELEAGEDIRTEVSIKFRPGELAAELRAAGLEPVAEWTDPDGDFLVTLAERSVS